MSQAANSGLHLLDDSDLEKLRKIIAKHGLAAAARIIDISRGVVSSASAGIGIRRGSIELIREALGKYSESAE